MSDSRESAWLANPGELRIRLTDVLCPHHVGKRLWHGDSHNIKKAGESLSDSRVSAWLANPCELRIRIAALIQAWPEVRKCAYCFFPEVPFRALLTRCFCFVQIKEIATDKLNTKLRESLESEISILQRTRHPNIIRLHEIRRVRPHLGSQGPRYRKRLTWK